MKILYSFLTILTLLFSSTLFANALTVSTCEELQNMKSNLAADYILINDIDCSQSQAWNNGAGFEPIGTQAQPFKGSLSSSARDGQAFAIYDLYINRPKETYVGLFGYISPTNADVHISNIGLVNPTITGDDFVGGIAGITRYTSIDRCFVESGKITGSYSVGGISGIHIDGNIDNTYTDTTVMAQSTAGGLVGDNKSIINNSYTTGEIIGTSSTIGGLVGANDHYQTIKNSYSTADVTGFYVVGGLVGMNQGNIEKSYATGDVAGSHVLGGLVGINRERISDSYAIGNVASEDYGNLNNIVGGLVGELYSGNNTDLSAIIERCYATGNVSSDTHVGGLVGFVDDGSITESYATGSVSGYDYVGGLVGQNVAYYFNSIINQSYATGLVVGHQYVGGLVGDNYSQKREAIVLKSYWDTDRSNQDHSDGGTGKTTAEMMQQATFLDWNFDTVWQIDENISYPYFQH
jgi:hypothetical protein